MNARTIAMFSVMATTPTGLPRQSRRVGRLAMERVRLVVREETFGDRLRRFRMSAGLRQEDLAELAGFGHRDTIYRYETNQKTPRADALCSLARALGTTMDTLWRGES